MGAYPEGVLYGIGAEIALFALSVLFGIFLVSLLLWRRSLSRHTGGQTPTTFHDYLARTTAKTRRKLVLWGFGLGVVWSVIAHTTGLRGALVRASARIYFAK